MVGADVAQSRSRVPLIVAAVIGVALVLVVRLVFGGSGSSDPLADPLASGSASP